jgi:hypothetical protein
MSKHFNYVRVQSKYKGVWDEHGKQIVGHKFNTHDTDFTQIVSRFVKKRVAFEFLLSGTHTSAQNDINEVW